MNFFEFISYLNVPEERKKEVLKITSEDDFFSKKEENILYILDLINRKFNLKELTTFFYLLRFATLKKMSNYHSLDEKEKKDLEDSINFLKKEL